MTFFITGLPRSRTKWLADYFSGLDQVFCWHEAMNGCHGRDQFIQKMTRLPVKHVGNSDSGLMLTDFQQWFMGCPTVVIERDIDDAEASLRRFLGPAIPGEHSCRPMLERQQKALQKVSGLRVAFDDIDDRLQEIHTHLVSVPFSEDYAQEMIGTNRQMEDLTVDVGSYQSWGII